MSWVRVPVGLCAFSSPVTYDLPETVLLHNLPWKRNKRLNDYWVAFVKKRASLYASSQYLVVDNCPCGKCHHLLKSANNVREIHCIRTKLKMVTGTDILQTNRASFNKNMVDFTCCCVRMAKKPYSTSCYNVLYSRNLWSLVLSCLWQWHLAEAKFRL